MAVKDGTVHWTIKVHSLTRSKTQVRTLAVCCVHVGSHTTCTDLHAEQRPTTRCTNLTAHCPPVLLATRCPLPLPPPSGAAESVTRLLPLCLLHHSPQVRRVAGASCRAVVGSAPGLMGPLLAGLRHWANNTQEAAVLAVSGHSRALILWKGVGSRLVKLLLLRMLCWVHMSARQPLRVQSGLHASTST